MNIRFWRPISVCWLEYYPWVVRFSGPLGAGLSSMSWRHYTWWYHLCLQMHFIMIIFRKWFGNRHAHTELDSKAVPRLQECCRQVEVEAVSNRRNKIHQTLEWSYSPALYMVSNSSPGRANLRVFCEVKARKTKTQILSPSLTQKPGTCSLHLWIVPVLNIIFSKNIIPKVLVESLFWGQGTAAG